MHSTEINLEGKTALVAGGAGEIGLAIVKGLVKAGAQVAVLDRKLESITEIQSENIRLKGFLTDLASVDKIKQTVRKVIDGFKAIDILVHAAGVNFHKSISDIDEDCWDKTMAVNLKSAFFLTQAVVPVMAASGGGKIIFISSVSARIGYPGLSDYTASKGGMEALVRNLAAELAPSGVCVNAIAPGTTRTQMTAGLWQNKGKCRAHEATIPLGRMARPEDHVGPVLFFASDLSNYITGTILPSDGGLTAIQADFIDIKLRGKIK